MPFTLFNRNPLARLSDRELSNRFNQFSADKDDAKALEVAEELIRRKSPNGYHCKALLLENKDNPQAIALIKQAIELCGSDEMLKILYTRMLARLQMEDKQFDAALATYDWLFERAEKEHSYFQIIEDFDFFLYLLTARNKKWELMKAGVDFEAEWIPLSMKLINRYVPYVHEADADEEVRPHLEALCDEITHNIGPDESKYC